MEIEINRANFNDLQDILKIQKNAFQYEAQIYQRNDLPALKQNLESIQTDFQKYDKRIFKNMIIIKRPIKTNWQVLLGVKF